MNKNILFIVLILTLIGACTDYSQYPVIDCIKFEMDDCHKEMIEGHFAMTSQNQYEEVMVNFLPDSTNMPQCQQSTLPNIDFNDYSLLGYRVCGSGCETSFEPTVYLDEVNKKYLYGVDVIEKGGCEPWVCSMNWILVPALPTDYFVEFL